MKKRYRIYWPLPNMKLRNNKDCMAIGHLIKDDFSNVIFCDGFALIEL